MTSTDDIMQRIHEHERRLAEARAPNARALFDALETAGVTSVDVLFDGQGDSGQIEGTTAYAGELEVKLPSAMIQYTDVEFFGTSTTTSEITVDDAIDRLVYAVLEETHGGWENNDGAYGEVTFNVEARTIHLEFNERYTATELYEHDFSADGPEGLDIPESERGFT